MGIPPDEFYAKPYKVRRFMLVSMQLQLEAEQEQIKEMERRGSDGGK